MTRTYPAQAQHLLSLARGVYAMARTTDVGQLSADLATAARWARAAFGLFAFALGNAGLG